MAEARHEAERRAHGSGESAATAERTVGGVGAESIGETAVRETERVAAAVREETRQTAQTAAQTVESGAKAALRSSVTVAEGVGEIAAIWTHYAEEVMRHSAQAGQALLRCRSWNEIVAVQTGLLRDNAQAFFDQSVKLAEIGSRLARSPFAAPSETGGGKFG